eukprot:1416229-Amphidinium_carterae.1
MTPLEAKILEGIQYSMAALSTLRREALFSAGTLGFNLEMCWTLLAFNVSVQPLAMLAVPTQDSLVTALTDDEHTFKNILEYDLWQRGDIMVLYAMQHDALHGTVERCHTIGIAVKR